MLKTLYCIRHGLAVHNVLYGHIGKKAYTDYRDTPLFYQGLKQAINLKNTWEDINKVELVLVSPSFRTLQTSSNIFYESGVKTIALDCLLEHPLGGKELCNKRNEKLILKTNFPWIDFSNINDVVEWTEQEENIEELQNRIDIFIKFVKNRPENHIAVVCHNSYLKYMLFKKIGNEDNGLKHCYPYVHKL